MFLGVIGRLKFCSLLVKYVVNCVCVLWMIGMFVFGDMCVVLSGIVFWLGKNVLVRCVLLVVKSRLLSG